MRILICCLTACIMFISCENQILNHEYTETSSLDKRGSPETIIEGTDVSGQKSYNVNRVICEYNFNPNSLNNDCGGYLNNCRVKYSYENDSERSLRNLEIFVPSKLKVEGTVYKTINLYTINRHEILSAKGALKTGNTWGTFNIYKVKEPVIFDEDKMRSNYGRSIETIR